jgi:hypothetical protein
MMTNLDFLVAITEAIETGKVDNQLDTIAKAVQQRKNLLRTDITIDDFSIGDRITINERCGTKYLRGETATIVGIRRTKLTIQFDNPSGRFARKNSDGSIYSSDVVVPIEIVDKKK